MTGGRLGGLPLDRGIAAAGPNNANVKQIIMCPVGHDRCSSFIAWPWFLRRERRAAEPSSSKSFTVNKLNMTCIGAIGAGAIVTIGTIVATSAIGAIVANESPLSTLLSMVPLDQLASRHWIAKCSTHSEWRLFN